MKKFLTLAFALLFLPALLFADPLPTGCTNYSSLQHYSGVIASTATDSNVIRERGDYEWGASTTIPSLSAMPKYVVIKGTGSVNAIEGRFQRLYGDGSGITNISGLGVDAAVRTSTGVIKGQIAALDARVSALETGTSYYTEPSTVYLSSHCIAYQNFNTTGTVHKDYINNTYSTSTVQSPAIFDSAYGGVLTKHIENGSSKLGCFQDDRSPVLSTGTGSRSYFFWVYEGTNTNIMDSIYGVYVFYQGWFTQGGVGGAITWDPSTDEALFLSQVYLVDPTNTIVVASHTLTSTQIYHRDNQYHLVGWSWDKDTGYLRLFYDDEVVEKYIPENIGWHVEGNPIPAAHSGYPDLDDYQMLDWNSTQNTDLKINWGLAYDQGFSSAPYFALKNSWAVAPTTSTQGGGSTTNNYYTNIYTVENASYTIKISTPYTLGTTTVPVAGIFCSTITIYQGLVMEADDGLSKWVMRISSEGAPYWTMMSSITIPPSPLGPLDVASVSHFWEFTNVATVADQVGSLDFSVTDGSASDGALLLGGTPDGTAVTAGGLTLSDNFTIYWEAKFIETWAGSNWCSFYTGGEGSNQFTPTVGWDSGDNRFEWTPWWFFPITQSTKVNLVWVHTAGSPTIKCYIEGDLVGTNTGNYGDTAISNYNIRLSKGQAGTFVIYRMATFTDDLDATTISDYGMGAH